MKLKKLFALALAVCMMVSVMPTSFAGNGFLSLDGVQPTTTTSGPSLTLDTPGTVSGGSVVTPSLSQSSQSVYTPYVYSNPYGVSSVADEGDGEGETTPAVDMGLLDAGETVVTAEDIVTTLVNNTNPAETKPEDWDTLNPAALVTNKSATPNGDGSYTITLESYVSGNKTTIQSQTKSTMDIVFVLDTSKEMVTGTYEAVTGQYFTALKDLSDAGNLYYQKNGSYYRAAVWSIAGFIFGVYTSSVFRPIDTGLLTEKYNDTLTLYKKTGDDSGDERLGQLKTAATTFITTVAEDSPNSRIALVKYAGSATVMTGEGADSGDRYALLPAGTNESTLTTLISNLKVDSTGAANCNYGLAAAKNIFQDSNANEEKPNPRVVILLSAGVFGSTGFLNSQADGIVAMDSIWLSTILKAANKTTATVDFSSSFYDGSWKRSQSGFETEFGKNYQGCGATVYAVGLGMPTTTDVRSNGKVTTSARGETASRINEVMYRVSSHRPDGTHPGTNKMYNNWETLIGANPDGGADGWNGTYPDTLTRNLKDKKYADVGYFLTADQTSQLNSIFTTIVTNVTQGGASINLGTATTVKDVLSPYFEIRDTDTDIVVKTKGYTASGFTGAVENITNSVTIDTSVAGTVKVNNFDFAGNWVGTETAANGTVTYRGKELIVEIKIWPKAGFLGGNNVPTNMYASGVYASAGAEAAVLEYFDYPTENVTIPDFTVTAANKNIYLSDSLNSDELVNGAYVVFTKNNELGQPVVVAKWDPNGENTVLESWQYAYLKGFALTSTVPDNQTNDAEFTVSCTVTSNDDTTVTKTADAELTVFKPHISFKDSTIYLGEEADYTDNRVNPCVEWLDNDGNTAKNMTGFRPKLEVTYSEEEDLYFSDCEFISITDVYLNGEPDVELMDESGAVAVDFVDLTTFWNQHEDGKAYETDETQFTVHVLYPSVNYQNSTVHLGFAPTAAYHKANNLVSAGKFITWADKNTDHGIASETGNNDSSFNYSFTPVDTALTECTPVTATITVKTLPNVTADEDEFTVHVVRPTITFADQVIYLSKQPDYINLDDDEEVASAFAWNTTCTEGTEVGSTTDVPAVTGTVAPAAFAIDYDKLETDPFLDCTPVNATVQFGSGDDAPDYTEFVTLKNSADADDVQRGNNTHEFTVHVLKPDFAVSGTDLYADYGTELGLDYKKEGQDYQAIGWSNEWKCATESCEDVKDEEDFIGDDADKATVSQVVYDVAHTPENAGVLTQDPDTKKWSYTVKTDDDNFTVELKEFKIGNITYDSENWAGVTYDGGATNDKAAFTIYVNKFKLTINTDWTESSGEQQSAIFTVTPDNADLMPIKVVVPKGVNSVVVAGLFSGQEYTIAEDNGWTWRYGTAADVVYGKGEDRIACVGGLSLKALNGTDEVTMSFDDGKTYNAKWLADEACVINKATTQATTINPTLSVKKKDEEVTGA